MSRAPKNNDIFQNRARLQPQQITTATTTMADTAKATITTATTTMTDTVPATITTAATTMEDTAKQQIQL